MASNCSKRISDVSNRVGCIFCVALFAQISSAFASDIVHNGPHFRLHVHGLDAKAAAQALDACETAATVWNALEPIENSKLLDVHLYRDRADYEAADQRLNAGALKRNGAFANWGDMSAHVWLQPPQSPKSLDELGLPLMTRRLLIHEATHLLRYASLPNHRSHPHWLADGIGQYISEKTMKQHGWIESAESDPGFSTHIVRVQKLIHQQRLPSIRQVLDDEIDAFSFYDRYALRWMFVRFLDDSGVWKQVYSEARRIGGGKSYRGRLARAVQDRLAAASLGDKEFAAYVLALIPRWHEATRSMNATGDVWVQTAFTNADAECWSSDAVSPSWSVRGTLRISVDESQRLAVLFGGVGREAYSVSLSSVGGVVVSRRGAGDRKWEEVRRAACRAIESNRDLAFEASIGGGALRLTIAGRTVIEQAVSTDWSGTWGLGTNAGSTGVWKAIVVNRGIDR